MARFRVHLFGKFHLERDDQVVRSLEGCKSHELLSYLLLYRQRLHPREGLATLLWGNCTTAQSKKHLRQALWQIQAALGSEPDFNSEVAANSRPDEPINLLRIDAEWVRVNSEADLWLDVAVFEQAYSLAHGISGGELAGEISHRIEEAVSLYTGDLLEGCYQDWCLFERERLQNAYLGMLDKLMSYAADRHDYEAALDYGETILRYNRARERTHREMMLMHYLAGDRTAALQQYGRCVAILRDELGATPAHRTLELYEQILVDDLRERDLSSQLAVPLHTTGESHLSTLLYHLQRLCSGLDEVQQQIRSEMTAISSILTRHN